MARRMWGRAEFSFCFRLHYVLEERIGVGQIGAKHILTTGLFAGSGLFVGFVFRDFRFVFLRLLQKSIANRARAEKRSLLARFPRTLCRFLFESRSYRFHGLYPVIFWQQRSIPAPH